MIQNANELVHRLLEGDEDLEARDIIASLNDEPDEITGRVTKIGKTRMKIADFGRYVFLISYLTPVAFQDKVLGHFFKTSKQWSQTTTGHIREFARIIANAPEWKADQNNWEESEWVTGDHYVRYPTFENIPQEEITAKFKEVFSKLKLNVRNKRKLYDVPKHFRRDYEGADAKTGWGSYANLHRNKHEMPDKWEADKINPDFFADYTPPEPEQGIQHA